MLQTGGLKSDQRVRKRCQESESKSSQKPTKTDTFLYCGRFGFESQNHQFIDQTIVKSKWTESEPYRCSSCLRSTAWATRGGALEGRFEQILSTDRIPRALQAAKTEDPLRRLSRLGRRRGEKFRLRDLFGLTDEPFG
jgi:hypothetical protein